MVASSNFVALIFLILLSQPTFNLANDSENQNGETEAMLMSLSEKSYDEFDSRYESQSATTTSTTTLTSTTGATTATGATEEEATGSTIVPATELDSTLIPSGSSSDEPIMKVGLQCQLFMS
jgi:hypothetical protein